MDKRVIFAVAGSGKTSLIIEKLNLDQRALIITYTDNNHHHLRNKIIQKFGVIPKNISLMTYFSFLHGFCFRPLMQSQLNTKGLNFRLPPNVQLPLSEIKRFRDASGRLYHNRLAKLLEVKGCVPAVLARLERFYDCVYVDEVQDFAGHDFNLLLAMSKAKADMMFVGDFYQHTFDTSRDGAVNSSLHDDMVRYEKRFRDNGITVDKETLNRSWRCGTTVCDFISTHLRIDIAAHNERESELTMVTTQAQADELHANPDIVKLFYQEHHKYGCFSQNWGASKGLDHFNDICVVMGPKIWTQYLGGRLHESVPKTRNKLYVACSRAKGGIFFAPEKLFKIHKR
ncbi:AAA family ATPase [Pseudomonas sp. C2B4]|jgi:DNA helicase-2/ATP-dependent DNA helicase PcrA|uniref:AAA family ATPase n=1 Tax=Pseudomonas sp. C2B4 TaxID=2735270 RepID=UPI0015860D03|nr:AAA family ATPase [Pseudomonas sp. C2B4]NUU34337.1 AAA family ATPase [Pseudomonas sp. C2B4]